MRYKPSSSSRNDARYPEMPCCLQLLVNHFRGSLTFRCSLVLCFLTALYLSYTSLYRPAAASTGKAALGDAFQEKHGWRGPRDKTLLPGLGTQQKSHLSDVGTQRKQILSDLGIQQSLASGVLGAGRNRTKEGQPIRRPPAASFLRIPKPGRVVSFQDGRRGLSRFDLTNATLHRRPPSVPIRCDSSSAVSETLARPPIKFLANYKNPCWLEDLPQPLTDLYKNNGYSLYSSSYKKILDELRTSLLAREPPARTRLRCLPYFFVAGMPKCGSTDLYRKLVGHPDVVTPPTKESHWWGRNRYGWCLNYKRPIPFGDYVDLYDQAAIFIGSHMTEDKQEELKDGYHPVITGDASVSTLWSNDDWWTHPENCGLREPLFTNAHHVQHLIPGAKVIVILRNPTERLFSDYLYFRESKSTGNFHQEATRAVAAYRKCAIDVGTRACVYNASLANSYRVRLRVGLYQVFLQEWLSAFPKEQLLVLRLEDYSRQPLETMRLVHDFLQLRKLSDEENQKLMGQPKQNTRKLSDQELGSMRPSTQALLDAFYRPYNVKLARLLGDKRFLWEDKLEEEEEG